MKKFQLLFFVMGLSIQAYSQQLNWLNAGGGPLNDATRTVAADQNGNVYHGGFFQNYLNTSAGTLYSHGSNDGFLAKYDAQGSCVKLLRIGGTFDDRIYDVETDNQGRVWLTGSFSGTDTFGTGASQTILTSAGNTDIFVACYDSSFSLLWAVRAGGNINDRGAAIVLDGTYGYITGFVASPAGGGGGGKPQSVDFGSFSINPIGRTDIFVAALDAKGSFQWANVYGSTRTDAATDIALNAAGDVMFCGNFSDTITIGTTSLYANGQQTDFFVGVLDASKGVGKGAFGGGSSGAEFGNSIVCDGSGNAFMAVTYSGNFTFGTTALNPVGGFDGALLAFDSNLQPIWAQSWGGSANDQGYGVSIDPYGNTVVSGTFNGNITQNGQSITSNGGDDAIILAFDNTGAQTWIYTGGTSGNDNVRKLYYQSTTEHLSFAGEFAGTLGATSLTFQGKTITSVDSSDTWVGDISFCTGISPKLSASGSTNFCQSGNVMLYAQLSNGFTYQWNYNGTPIAGATSDSFYTDSAGSYTCTINNGTCSLTTQAITVNIGTPPSATISAAYTSFCTGDSAAITANSGAGYTYTLYLNGNAVKTASNNVFFATQAGDYQVEVNNYGCTAMSNTITMTTIPGINVSISTSGNTSFCNGDSIRLQATSDTTWFYQWTVNGNNVTNGNSDFVYATQNGTYQVLVVNTNSCQALSNTIDVQVFPSPRANLNVPDSALCSGDSVILSIQTGGGGGFGNTYQWTQNGADISGQTTRFLTVKTSGDYACKVTNQAGCTTTSRTTTIQVDTTTSTSFNVGSTLSLCGGDSVQLVANNAGQVLYQWYENSVPVGSGGNTYWAKNAANYSVRVSSATCATTYLVTVASLYPAAAIPSIFQNSNTMLSSLTGTAYQWYFNGAAVSGANAQSFTTFYAGSYEVEVTDANGCVGRSAPFNFTPNGISGVSLASWKIYPNPSKGLLTIEGLTGTSSDLILVDMQGRQVGRWTVSGEKTHLPLIGVPAGMYVLKVVTDNSADVVRLIVE